MTSNHVHLLLTANKGSAISKALRHLHGRVGQWRNKQLKSSGSFTNVMGATFGTSRKELHIDHIPFIKSGDRIDFSLPRKNLEPHSHN